jgi:putative Mg2+ transporter-C (MgtC) family protein
MQMPYTISLIDVFIRLLLALIAGMLIGLNRESAGQAAGLRTTILICLAAAVAMIQTNILLSMGGKTTGSFVNMDVMRLPLGILTGVGFIGAGCILKKGHLIKGITTAATLWLVTVIGLCFGGGQLYLGIITTLTCLIVIGLLKKLNYLIPRTQNSTLSISSKITLSTPPDLNPLIQPLGYKAHFFQWCYDPEFKRIAVSYIISWEGNNDDLTSHDLLRVIEKEYFINSFTLEIESS